MTDIPNGDVMYYDPQNQLLIHKTVEFLAKKITLRDLKEFSLLNVLKFLDSDDKIICKLIGEIEGSIVEIEEELLTEQEFKNNLKDILSQSSQPQNIWTGSSVSFLNFSEINYSFAPENPTLQIQHAVV